MNISNPTRVVAGNLAPHPFAALLPLLNAAGQSRLNDDVAAHGVLQPITLFEGKVLDGRHRLTAALANGDLNIPAVELQGTRGEAMAFVMSQNIRRRQLSASQLALCAARVRAVDTGSGYLTQVEVANEFVVSVRYVRDAQRLMSAHRTTAQSREHGPLSPQARARLIASVDDGSLSLHDALAQAFPRVARSRPPMIDPMPANPALEPIPAMDAAAGNVITQAARAIAALRGDPTSWLQTLTADESRSLLPTLEVFARLAVDRVNEEIGLAAAADVPAPAPAPAPRMASSNPFVSTAPAAGAGIQTIVAPASAIAAARVAGRRP